MKQLVCPKCNNLITIDISKALDSEGTIFKCDNCNYKIMYDSN